MGAAIVRVITRARGALGVGAVVAGAVVIGATAGDVRAQAPLPDPDSLLARAIEAGGGEQALQAARALTWEGDAFVTSGGRVVRITGTWMVQPPDTAIVATWDVTRGPATMRALVIAVPRGWIVAGDRFDPMPPTLLAAERDEFHLYELMRLVGVRAPSVTRTAAPPDTAGNPGVRVSWPGRRDVVLHMDRATGRLVHLQAEISDAQGTVRQDAWLEGTIEADGVRWPRTLRLLQDGAPYFLMTLRTLRTAARLDDPRLAGPR
ncbi:MAG: hypothetical protein MUF21_11885 [Gemmatimonadaceae bacterium]|jgi:hypothetical protein|nr:hypothetical protein [Gemmatimonadaceae bacterium]